MKGLTAREFQVCLLVAEGYTDKAIGKRLGITERTVRDHVHNSARKLGYAREPERNVRVRVARDPRCHASPNILTVAKASTSDVT